ncbi:MAG: T9SS type A sorting domain-containing protein [Bacteroidetes bacterium]|nr:T9SS type A sorting domain-containing protein [Bacteroidota bacterium]
MKHVLLLSCLFLSAMGAIAQTQYSHGDPTPDEQYMLELINRARANPAEEGVRVIDTDDADVQSAYQYWNINKSATKAAFATYAARPPLAFNAECIAAARRHGADQVANNFQGHNGTDGSTPFTRMNEAGFTGWTYAGENVAAYSSSVWYGHCGLIVDWGTQNQIDLGHRTNILNISNYVYTEIGIDIKKTSGGLQSGTVGPYVITQDFGLRPGRQFIVGVVYSDKNNNKFYDQGEGLAGVRVQPASGSTYYAITSTSGGYAIPYTGSGTITVNATGGPLGAPMVMNVSGGGGNVKADFIVAPQPPASATLLSPSNAATKVTRPVSMKWKSAASADSYVLQISTTSGFVKATTVEVKLTDTTHTATDLACNTKYWWRVKAVNGAGESSWSTPWTLTTLQDIPAVITGLKPTGAVTADLGSKINIKWKASTLADPTYHYRVSTVADFKTILVEDSTLTDTTVKFEITMPSSTLYWAVRAKNDCGWGPWTAATAVTLTVTDVAEEGSMVAGLMVTPNPVSNGSVVRISADRAMRGTLRCTDVSGRVVFEQTMDVQEGTTSLSAGSLAGMNTLQSGMYLLSFTSDRTTITTTMSVLR